MTALDITDTDNSHHHRSSALAQSQTHLDSDLALPLLAEIWAGHLNYPSLSFFSCKMGCPNHLTSGSNLSPRADLKVLCEGESLHCSPKTITALLISYTPQYKIKSSKFKKFYVKPPRPAACLADTKSTNKVDQIHFGHYFCFSSP